MISPCTLLLPGSFDYQTLYIWQSARTDCTYDKSRNDSRKQQNRQIKCRRKCLDYKHGDQKLTDVVKNASQDTDARDRKKSRLPCTLHSQDTRAQPLPNYQGDP